MGDPPTPYAAAPPPRSSMPMLYYGIFVIGTAAIVLALYNLIIVRWCTDLSGPGGRPGTASNWRFHHLNIASSISSFKYRRDGGGDEEDHSECAVCLSVFEEGEELRRLPKCKHCFHAPCIDMWLYSHIDCPLCRCAVELPGVQRRPPTAQQHSHEGFLLPVTV